MKKENFIKRKKPFKFLILIITSLITIILISSTSISITFINVSTSKNENFLFYKEEISIKKSIGLAPQKNINNPIDTTSSNNYIDENIDCIKPISLSSLGNKMWGYIANSTIFNEGTCWFDLDDPGEINFLQNTISDYFIAGGTGTGDDEWLGVQYNNGLLWLIDRETGDMYSIGGGGTGLNGCSWDPTLGRLYGLSSTALYEIDPDTGEQELIGQLGIPNSAICIAIDLDGVAWVWDVLSSNDSTLYTCDLESGECTEYCSIGENLMYAQDGDWDFDTGILWFTAYSTSGFLAYFDFDNEELVHIGDFEGGTQITASSANFGIPPPYNDVGVKEIIKPMNGYANEEMEVIFHVKNYGNNSVEDISVNVVILKESIEEDYSKTVNIEKLIPGEIAEVVLHWTPSDWQNGFDDYIDYKITVYATVWPDYNPNNDYKEKFFNLYFPWFHDIEMKSINSPFREGPGKTYSVNTTIKNVGQYNESGILINVSIGEPVILNNLLYEENWSNVPPEGWHDDHKDYDPEYGWEKSYTSKSGGTSSEAYISYENALADHYFYSHAIYIEDYSLVNFRFKSYIDHNNSQGFYALEAGYSYDTETWYAVWHDEPSFSRRYEVEVPIKKVDSETIYVGFWIRGDPCYFNYWYIDDVELSAMSINEEYSDTVYTEAEIFPGEEIIIEFDDWTPDFLQYGTTGSKDFIIASSIEIDGDENPANDITTEQFILDFWHDVGIYEVTSPTGGPPYYGNPVIWYNGEPDGRYALPGSTYNGYSNILIDDFEVFEDSFIISGKVHYIWNGGYSINLKKLNVYIFKDEGECNPSLVEYPEEGYHVEANLFDEYTTGNYYFGRPEIIVQFYLDELIYISEGKWYIGIQPVGIIDDLAYILTAPDRGCIVMADLPYWEYPRWTSSRILWGEGFDLSWELNWNLCAYPRYAYIKPGMQDINATVKNYGTFPKENLTCYAEIWEYITDPLNGTKIYTDEISNIDLPSPLGGIDNLEFVDFEFTEEGKYSLILDLPADPDNKQSNNKKRWGIAVDETNPESVYPPYLDPAKPNGKNGWYVDNVEVTLNASDPYSNGVSSGVKEIIYTINSGAENVINGSTGSFLLTEEGKNILIEYWAVDWVGNVETTKNSFTIDIDQTVPEIQLEYEVTGGNKWIGWDFTFTAIAKDDTSGMDYVEFYLNDVWQITINGSGPEYSWTIRYNPLPKAIFKAIGFDKAGLFNSDEIEDPICKKLHIISKIIRKISYKSHGLQIPYLI